MKAAMEARRLGRRQRLVDAALELFATQGYHDTSVEDVVAAARTSKSAFYTFFESKEDCLRELVRGEGGALIEAVTVAAAGGTGPRASLRLGIRAFVDACYRRQRLARLLVVESIGISDGVEEVRHDIQARFATMVEETARRAQASDPFYAAIEPDLFGRAVVGAVNEVTGYFLGRGEAHPEDLAEGLCQIFAPQG